jgi:hypothetical protein
LVGSDDPEHASRVLRAAIDSALDPATGAVDDQGA